MDRLQNKKLGHISLVNGYSFITILVGTLITVHIK